MSNENTENQEPNGTDVISGISKRYFHQLSQDEVNKLVSDKATWGYILKTYDQPKWCGYPNALEGQMGCWSLIDISEGGLRTKISPEFCKSCDQCNAC